MRAFAGTGELASSLKALGCVFLRLSMFSLTGGKVRTSSYKIIHYILASTSSRKQRLLEDKYNHVDVLLRTDSVRTAHADEVAGSLQLVVYLVYVGPLPLLRPRTSVA